MGVIGIPVSGRREQTWGDMIKGVALVHVLHAFALPAGVWSLMRPDDQLQLVGLQKRLSIHNNCQ